MVPPADGSSTRTPVDEIGGTNMTTKKPATETGTFLGEFPYVRLGNGPENLVILPGISTLENEPPNRLAAWTYRLGFGRFAEGRTVYVINRRRGMPPRVHDPGHGGRLRPGDGRGAGALTRHRFLHGGSNRPVRRPGSSRTSR